MWHIKNVCFVFLFVLLGGSGQQANAQALVLYALHLPPHMIDASIDPPPKGTVPRRAAYGADVELIRAAYATQGVTVHFKFMPWKRIIRNVEAGEILGAASCRVLSSRNKFAFFSQAVSQSVSAFVTRRSYLDGQAPSLKTLANYNIIAVNGWSQTNILDNAHLSYTSVSGLKQGFNLILRRNQDVFATERDSAIFEAKRLGLFDQLSFYDMEGLNNQEYSVCFSKKYPNAEYWRDVLNRGLDQLKASGEWNVIAARYGLAVIVR